MHDPHFDVNLVLRSLGLKEEEFPGFGGDDMAIVLRKAWKLAYAAGRIDMAEDIAMMDCEHCSKGEDPEEDDDRNFIHKPEGKEIEVLCKSQTANRHVKLAEGERRQAYCDFKYGNSWHTYYWSNEPLADRCYCCGDHATKRIDVNCWGCVSEADVCDSCAGKHDGNCMDALPKFEKK